MESAPLQLMCVYCLSIYCCKSIDWVTCHWRFFLSGGLLHVFPTSLDSSLTAPFQPKQSLAKMRCWIRQNQGRNVRTEDAYSILAVLRKKKKKAKSDAKINKTKITQTKKSHSVRTERNKALNSNRSLKIESVISQE